MFKNAIVRRPGHSLINGITSAPELGKPDYGLAKKQHDAYIDALKSCAVEVTVLDADEKFPDSCFVEDVAVCTKKFVVITNPGASSRKGEEKEIIEIIKKYYNNIEYIKEPGTLEGGDVMMVKDHFYIGLSKRTNREGAEQLIKALEKYGMSGSIVEISEMLHLKNGLAYLEDNVLLVTGEYINNLEFKKFNKILIDEEEIYSTNCIRVNDYVLVPASYPKTKEKIKNAGFKIIVVDISEYRKVNGGLSCLSLRF